MKTGILTFHRCINYGSFWQAHCLVNGLRAKGHDAVILEHHSRRVNLAEWRCAYNPVLPIEVLKSDHPEYRKKIEGFFKAFQTLPLSRRFPLDAPEQMDNYDTVIVGSDEVWNLLHPWYGRYELFYGEGIKTNRLISYAASFGNYPAAWGLEQHWAEKLWNFQSISVRDSNSQALVREATGIEAELVLDPCLQFPMQTEERASEYWEEPCIAVYGHNFSESFIKGAKQYASDLNLPLISIGYRNDWADKQWISADPHEFAHFMANAKAVVTNFFHGCVFALRNQKPFVCETSPYRNQKILALMEKIGGMQHLFTEERSTADYHKYLQEPIDQTILYKIDLLRHSSSNYLDRALGLKQLQRA
jgi:hypothetical protein